MMKQDQQAPLAQLTSLRLFAALLVLFSHFQFFARSGSPALERLYDLVFRQGACGVTFFFILSGFILTHAYERALVDEKITASTYFYRRLARIFPLHLIVGLAFLAYLAWRADVPPLRAVMLNLTLLHSWFPDPIVHYSLNGPSWSLSDELFFYALFPWLVRLSQATLLRFFCIGTALIIAASGIAAARIDGYSPFADWLFYAFPPTRLFEFVAGILLCRAWRAGTGRRWASSGTEALLVMTVLATMVAVEWFALPLVLRYQLAFLPPMAALILIFAHGEGALSRLLRHPSLQLMGEASFALYLIHRPLITFMERWAGHGAASDLALGAAMLSLSLVGALFAFVLLDQPVQHWLRRRERRVPGQTRLVQP
ncbi:acyltransferase family protein [Sphingobium bisphenolivorans]|uniref:acyltransferase family protein n=1 Tax=Sphingobium bisphenolivorans TaxID=1335760 RepID=UPI0003A54472|nr:acyltransferase [Sphingobium bisphenolivorans]